METETARTGRTDRSKVRAVGRERRSYDGYYREDWRYHYRKGKWRQIRQRTGGYCKSEEPDFYLRRSDEENYLEIGKIYFEQYSDMPEPPFEKQCEAIKNSQRAIADLQEKSIS